MSARRIILVPPAAPGSKGDEGMVRGTIELFRSFPIVIVNPEQDSSWLEKLELSKAEREHISEVPGPMSEVAEHLKATDLLFFIGADVIDGTCGVAPSFERLNLATDALIHGIEVYATCSFRSRVVPEILERLRLMSEMHFLIRDDDSLANFRRQTGLDADYFPDVSFFTKDGGGAVVKGTLARINIARKTNNPIIGVNFAEHSFRSFFDVHSDDSRQTFVSAVLRELANAHPNAFYVLISNDMRSWENHPSDDHYAEIAFEWINRNIGADRARKVDSKAGYSDNITVLRSIDLLVTGRMHLSLAAFRAATIPLVLMGQGKAYTSIDKMRGTYKKYLGTTDAVISDVENVGSQSLVFLAERDRLAEHLRNLNLTSDSSNREIAETLLDRLQGGVVSKKGENSRLHAALISALAVVTRRSVEFDSERARTNGLRQELIEALRQNLAQTQEKLEAQDVALRESKQVISDLRVALEQERTVSEKQRHDLIVESAVSETLRQDLAHAQARLEAQDITLRQTEQAFSDLKLEFARDRAALERNEWTLLRTQAVISDLSKERNHLSESLNHRERALEDLRNIAHERAGTIEQLREAMTQHADGAAAARSRAEQLERSTTWRATRPARAVVERLPQPVRRIFRRIAKAMWWTITPHRMLARIAFLRNRRLQLLAAEEQANEATRKIDSVLSQAQADIGFGPAGTVDFPAGDAPPERILGGGVSVIEVVAENVPKDQVKPDVDRRSSGPRILVADYRIPRADVSAGERATVGLIADLRAIGYEVTFAPNDMTGTSPYREELEELGVEVITRDSGYPYAADYIVDKGSKFDAFYFIRVDVMEAMVAAARRSAPEARIIFHAPDLYSLREGRGAEFSGDPEERATAERTRSRELAMMQAADHIVLVSPAEVPHIDSSISRSKISVFPALYSAIVSEPAGYRARKNIFFIGGFAHTPNVSAVVWFVDEVWPIIHAALPDLEFHILGAEAPEAVVNLAARPGVRVVGYISDLNSMLANYRLSVAPLLYGAGIKGKVGTAMGAGVPMVLTPIAAEGMGIRDGIHALVREEPTSFAEAVAALYRDETLWTRIARNARQLVEANFGEAANRSAFLRVMDNAGALPLQLYLKYCQDAEPAGIPDPDPAQVVDVSVIVPVHNQWNLTRACLNSVVSASRATGLVSEIILADDASSDDTLAAARTFPGLRVVRQERNVGFLLNSKAAAAAARGRYLVFLNNDTIVLPGWLTALVQLADQDPSAAIVGSKLLYPDGTIQEAGAVLFSDSTAHNLGRGLQRHEPQFCFDSEVDYATGASMLVRRSFWDSIGGFDERFVPAYCEDSDLAMTARSLEMRVVYAANSEVVHFEYGSYGAEIAAKPRLHQQINGRKLVEKWSQVFAEAHLSASTPYQIAAANAERSPPPAARHRRQKERLNILYFSPFPSHPDNHGNQATIQSFGRRFQQMGHKVHFALLQSPIFDSVTAAAMRRQWDTFDILPNSKALWADGNEIPFDSWYDDGLGESIRALCHRYDIDVVFCSYIFQSKLLEFVPAHILKVIDTHDKMGDRYEMLRRNGQPVEFFSCTPEEEGAYLRRADIVVARRDAEARYFDSVTGVKTAIVIPHVEEARFIQRNYQTLKHVGVVASANRINLAIVRELLECFDRTTSGDCPLVVHVAGQVRDMVGSLPDHEQDVFRRPWVDMRGFVENIGDFYRQMDLVISPVTMGTGINVKTVQAMAYGMPLLTTKVGIKGIETTEPLHNHATLDELAKSVFMMTPQNLNALARLSMDRYRLFLDEAEHSIYDLFHHQKLQGAPAVLSPVGSRSARSG